MTGRYKEYPKYKESKLEWLGDVPEHWEVEYSKWLFQERNNKAKATDEMLTASQKYGVIPQKMFMKLEQQKVVQVQKGHGILKKVLKDDFVISMRSFQGGIEFCSYNGAVSSAYVPLEPKKRELSCFFKYLFKSKPFIQALQATSNLVRDGQALRYNNFIQVRLLVPTSEEAESISNFLDHETAKIDTLIAKQEKLIELLKEKRQAVISHAVTKGLNPNAPMRDSGVEWLGEVPKHWQVVRLRFLCKITTGSRDTQDAKAGGQYPFFVRSDNIQSIDTYSFDGEGVMTSGDGAGVGKIFHHFIGKCEIHQRVYLFYKFRLITPRYFYHYLKQNLEPIALAQSAKSTVDSLRLPILQEFSMCFGNETEQNEICLYVDLLNEKYAALIQSASRAIELMKERKTALISAAVTGKIDVRDFAVDEN
jgi:type I restriction enzyme, S subunit